MIICVSEKESSAEAERKLYITERIICSLKKDNIRRNLLCLIVVAFRIN